jgi:hypothetical protein
MPLQPNLLPFSARSGPQAGLHPPVHQANGHHAPPSHDGRSALAPLPAQVRIKQARDDR